MSAVDPSSALTGRMARGGAVTIASTVSARVVGAAAAVVLVRSLGLEDFATFTFGVAFALVFSTVSDLGLDTVVVREVAANPADRGVIIRSAVVAKVLAVVCAAGVGGGVALLYDDRLRLAALLGTLSVFQAVPSTYGLALTAELKMGMTSAIRLAGQIGSAVGAAVVATAGGGPTLALAAFVGIGFAPGLALLAIVRHRLPEGRADQRRVRRLFREAMPVAVSTLAIILFARVDQLLLAALGTDVDLASYGVAVRVVDVLNVVPIGVAAVVLPAVSRLREEDPARVARLTRRAHRYLAAVALPAAAIASVVGGDALGFVFGRAYADSGAVLAILLWAHAFAFAFVLSRQVLIGLDRSPELARASWIAAAVNVALNLALIPSFGAEGAALASLVAYAMPVLVAVARGRSRDRAVDPFALATRPIGQALAAAAIVLAATHLLDARFAWGLAGVGGVMAAFVALVATRTVTRDDLSQMAVALRRGSP